MTQAKTSLEPFPNEEPELTNNVDLIRPSTAVTSNVFLGRHRHSKSNTLVPGGGGFVNNRFNRGVQSSGILRRKNINSENTTNRVREGGIPNSILDWYKSNIAEPNNHSLIMSSEAQIKRDAILQKGIHKNYDVTRFSSKNKAGYSKRKTLTSTAAGNDSSLRSNRSTNSGITNIKIGVTKKETALHSGFISKDAQSSAFDQEQSYDIVHDFEDHI